MYVCTRMYVCVCMYVCIAVGVGDCFRIYVDACIMNIYNAYVPFYNVYIIDCSVNKRLGYKLDIIVHSEYIHT